MPTNPFAKNEDAADLDINPITLAIYSHINETLMNRDTTNVLRGSSATMCVKRRWYQGKGYIGKPLTPRKILNFMQGDIAEKTLAYHFLKACVGEGKLYKYAYFGDQKGTTIIQGREIPVYGQIESSFKLTNGQEVLCHFDGIATRHDMTNELIEFKTSSDYGFKKFQEIGPEDYLKQAHAYMMTDKCRHYDIKKVTFIYLRKSTGHIADRTYNYDPKMAFLVVDDFKTSIQEKEPKAPYGFVDSYYRRKKTGKKKLDWRCQYCAYLERCKGKHQIEWKKDQWGNMKPNYVFKGVNDGSGKSPGNS